MSRPDVEAIKRRAKNPKEQSALTAYADRATLLAYVESLEDKLQEIDDWAKAYPLDVFPEPDWQKAAQVLKDNGMTLDSISASNMRHVITRVREIASHD